jgi:hypothetical protein
VQGKSVVTGQGKLGDQLIAKKTKKEQKGESTIRKRRVFMHKRVLLVAQRKREQEKQTEIDCVKGPGERQKRRSKWMALWSIVDGSTWPGRMLEKDGYLKDKGHDDLQNQTSLSLLLLAGCEHGSGSVWGSAGGLRTFLLLLRSRVCGSETTTASRWSWEQALSLGDDSVDSGLENFVHTGHLFTAAFHVEGAHLLGDSLALVLCDGGKPLGPEEVDAGALVAQVGLETKEDDGSGRAEMKDFRVPLGTC